MKKLFALILAGVMAFSLAACGEKKTENNAPEENNSETIQNNDVLTGGWSRVDSPVITDDIKAVVEKAVEKLTGVVYTPVVYVGSQVVAGTNHLVLCKAEPVVPDAVQTYSLLTIYEDLQDNAEITEILACDAEAGIPDLEGGWNAPDSPLLTSEAKAALEKSTEKLVGAEYTPIALLGTQVVAGTNYSILCEITASSPEAEPNYAVVIVYEDLEGGAEITDSFEFESNNG